MLSEGDAKLFEEFSAKVRAQFPDAKIWAFGSRARGDAHEGSDLDICVALAVVTPEIKERIRYISWEISYESGVLLTSIIFEEERMRKGPLSKSTIVNTILREGIPA